METYFLHGEKCAFVQSFNSAAGNQKGEPILKVENSSKHFNVVLTLPFGWYNVATWDSINSLLKQRCIFPHWKFTMSNNLESTLDVSTLIWTTLDNVETTLSFSTLSFTTLVNVEKTLRKWIFLKRIKKNSNRIHEIQSFNYYFLPFFTLLSMLRGICRRVLARPQKLSS